jgi:HAD superfamily hydrolase (TIGR01484 family)
MPRGFGEAFSEREAQLPPPETRPVTDIPEGLCKKLRAILFDIDDTFTFLGKIHPGAFSALWEAREAGLLLLPITGRPAGWADHIARMWPVDGVVGENGAFYFCFDKTEKHMRKHFVVPERAERERNHDRLTSIFREIQRIYPTLRLASDQAYRECDLAIDYCEDASPPLSLEEARQIQKIFESHGARAKISSIHVNAWFGDYDKLSTCKRFFGQEHGIDLDAEKQRFLFLGDSPNDSPMFSFFPLSAGVAGVQRFWESGLMEHMPKFIASDEGSFGFEETLRAILEKMGE